MLPSNQQVADFLQQAGNGSDIQTAIDADPTTPVYAIYDSRVTNLGQSKYDGIDLGMRYTHDTGFGSIYANVVGTYRLNVRTALSSTAPFGPNTAPDTSRARISATFGALIGDHLRAQATLNHRQGYRVTPQSTNNFQTRVASFNVVNTYVEYDFGGEGLTHDLTLSLGVDNIFDRDPPTYRGDAGINVHGYTNGFTLGRLFQIGLQKKL
jgi:iron complex outermembrane receptor protein